MTEDLNNIDKLFKAAIDGHEEAASDESWKVIDKELDRNNIITIRKKYADLKKLVAVLLVLLSGTIIYEWHSAYSSKTINTSIDSNQSNTNNYNSISAINKNNTATDYNNAGDLSKTNQHSEAAGNNNTTYISTAAPKSVLTNNNNVSVKSNEKSAAKILPQLKESNNITTPVITTDNANATNNKTANDFIKIKKKGRFFASSTSATISDDDSAIGETITAPNNNSEENNKTPSKQFSTGLLKPLSRQAVISHAATGFATTSVTLQNNILLKTIIKNNSAAATTKTRLNKASRFSASVFYSPSLPSDLIEDDDDGNRNNSNIRDDAAHIKKGEHQSSYSFGSSIEYAINKHWSIQSGLTFIQKVSHINPKTIYAEDAGNGNIGYLFNFSSGYSYLPSKSSVLAIGDSAQASRSTNALQYVCIPLQAKYTISKGKFNFNVSLGASYNILLKGTLETEVVNDTTVENETVNKITGLKPGYISGLMGFGAEYPVTKKIAVCFNPSFNLAFTSITQGAPVRSYPSFFSFAAGLHISL
jgi:hypothetical protein